MISDRTDAVQASAPLMLVVEDSNEDFEVWQRLLQRSPFGILVHRCVNGDQALAFLDNTVNDDGGRRSSRPGLIVLDLNLPGTDGREVLRQIKQNEKLKLIPVVVFTTSSNPKDIEDCYRYGVNSYIVKPINFTQLKHDIQTLINYWFDVTTLPNLSEE